MDDPLEKAVNRAATQRWRDDALEKAAEIVERHLGKEAAVYIAQDIRALKSRVPQ